MSRKKKAMRAFLFQNPEATRTECWDAAWANEQSRVSSLKHQELEAESARLRGAMHTATTDLRSLAVDIANAYGTGAKSMRCNAVAMRLEETLQPLKEGSSDGQK